MPFAKGIPHTPFQNLSQKKVFRSRIASENGGVPRGGSKPPPYKGTTHNLVGRRLGAAAIHDQHFVYP